ncbi:MAG: PCRF domain-containing protein, partial [Candidatus Uhrbacteria bacterium]|nr:PCRF domain-containing protein [Candidatus Uhrbacteria bacterium]
MALDASKARLIELEADMNDPAFWNDQERARKASQETADLKREIAEWDALRTELEDLKAVEEVAENENDQAMLNELDGTLVELEKRFAGMEFQMLFSAQYDSRNAILSIHAGAGGTDANDWTAMLLRMYTRFAETHGFAVDVLDESRAEEAGFKSVTIAVRGRHAYGWLRSEAGVHRLVRISPFDAEKMRHTTFALVEVLPEFDDVDEKAIDLDPDELR